MRILRIIASADLAGGGPIEGVQRVGRALAKIGIRQDIATLDPPSASGLPDYEGTVFPLGREGRSGSSRRLWNRYGYSPRAVPWLRAHLPGYDAAIVSGLWNYSTLAARRALIGSGTPYAVFTHGMLDPWFRETYPAKTLAKQMMWLVNEGVLLRNAEAVLFTSEEERLRARGAFWPYRVRERVVAYGTADVAGDPDRQIAAFRSATPAVGSRRFLLFLSRVHEKKGCDLLVDAFASAAGRDPDLDLVIAGPDQVGLRAALEKRAATLGVASRIHWPGMLRGDVKWGAMHACDAFILPSHQENFGIAVAEALACGRPVLISDKINIWREIEGDGAGFVAPDTAAGTLDLIERFQALDEPARVMMGARARACFQQRFDIARGAHDLAAIVTEIAASRGHSRRPG